MEDIFEPRWLYHAMREPELVETQEMYDALMSQGGWASSPAAFGQVTAPNREQMALLRSTAPTDPPVAVLRVPAVAPVGPSNEKLEELESEIEALHKLVAAQVATVQRVEQQMAGLLAKVEALGASPHEPAPGRESGGKK